MNWIPLLFYKIIGNMVTKNNMAKHDKAFGYIVAHAVYLMWNP